MDGTRPEDNRLVAKTIPRSGIAADKTLPPLLASAAAAQSTHVKESIQTPEAGVVGVVAAPRKIELGHQSHSHPHSLEQPTPTFPPLR